MIIGVIDIETTGFLPKGKIVEVAVAKANTVTGLCELVFSEVVFEPGVEEEAEAWIFQNSDLAHAEVMQAKPLSEQLPVIQELIDGFECVTAFNKQFDFGFLRSRGVVINNEAPCLMLALTPVMRLPKTRGQGYKWPNLVEAWRFCYPEAEYAVQHRGGDDALQAGNIALRLWGTGGWKFCDHGVGAN